MFTPDIDRYMKWRELWQFCATCVETAEVILDVMPTNVHAGMDNPADERIDSRLSHNDLVQTRNYSREDTRLTIHFRVSHTGETPEKPCVTFNTPNNDAAFFIADVDDRMGEYLHAIRTLLIDELKYIKNHRR